MRVFMHFVYEFGSRPAELPGLLAPPILFRVSGHEHNIRPTPLRLEQDLPPDDVVTGGTVTRLVSIHIARRNLLLHAPQSLPPSLHLLGLRERPTHSAAHQ